MSKLIDCHTHIQLNAFKEDSKQVIQRALDSNIWLVNVGTQFKTSLEAVRLANQYKEGVYATVGLHPNHTGPSYLDESELSQADHNPQGEEFLYQEYLELARNEKTVAIGECGLDYFRNEDEKAKEKQKQVFLEHVRLACEVNKPLMIHCRPSKGSDDAYHDLFEILEGKEVKKILHFYVGSLEMTKKFLTSDYYFEFGGVVTFTTDYNESINLIPLNRLLLETDAPYVSPAPYRGKRNEPLYITEVAKKLAQIKGVEYNELAEISTANARKIFNI